MSRNVVVMDTTRSVTVCQSRIVNRYINLSIADIFYKNIYYFSRFPNKLLYPTQSDNAVKHPRRDVTKCPYKCLSRNVSTFLNKTVPMFQFKLL